VFSIYKVTIIQHQYPIDVSMITQINTL